jgi:hypothetical protein
MNSENLKNNSDYDSLESCHKNVLRMQKSEVIINSLEDYYASHRAPAIIYHKIKIGRVFATYKDNLIIIDGENKKEHEYLIPKSKVDRYGDSEVYFNISESSLKEFEI